MALIVPDRLARVAAQPDAPTREWFAALPDTVDAACARWGLRLGPPFQPGGVGSWVAPGVDREGRDVVLKLRWRYPEATAEVDCLRQWDGSAAVRLLDAFSDHDAGLPPDSDAMLLERARPGVALGRVLAEFEQDRVVADLIRRLRTTTPPASAPSLVAMCDAWAAETQEEYDRLWAQGVTTSLAAAEVTDALALLRSLAAQSGDQVLLCTDLHAENVVSAKRAPWLVIDPHPHVGDPTYDLLQHLLNCRDRLVADPRWLVARMAALIDVDAQRARQWLYARAVQESLTMPWLVDVVVRLRPRS